MYLFILHDSMATRAVNLMTWGYIYKLSPFAFGTRSHSYVHELEIWRMAGPLRRFSAIY